MTSLAPSFLLIQMIALILSLQTTQAVESNSEKNVNSSKVSVFDHSHSLWTSILQKYLLTEGPSSKVRYESLSKNPSDLNQYLTSLQAVTEREFFQFNKDQQLAFLINAYNAYTVKLIIDHYPVSSIKDIGKISLRNLTGKPWKIKFFTLLGKQAHLDNIEHDMIREWYEEPRIHFAVVCAAVGCPALQDEAFTGDKLETQLEAATNSFLSDHSRNRFLPDAKKLEVSSIFRWYRRDFEKKHGSVKAFLAPRMANGPNQESIIRSKKVRIVFLDYDWSLNDTK